MITEGGNKCLGRVKGWVLGLLLGSLAVAAQAETVTSVTQYGYDAAGRPTCQAVRMNPAVFGALPADACALGAPGPDGPDRITYTDHDAAGRITRVTSGYGTSAPYAPRVEKAVTYTANGQEATVADGEGRLTTYEYDGFDRLAKVRYPTASNGAVSSSTDYETYGYDGAGNRTSWRRRDGTSVTFGYDALNRALNGVRGELYAYDNLGRRVSATYAGGSGSATYDALGRTTSETTNGLTMAYRHDLAGRRTRITWPDTFFATYAYDAAGEVTGIFENDALQLTAYTYDNLGRRLATYRQNGADTFYGYDAASRLASLALNPAGTGNDQTWSFAYNAAGQVRGRTAANAVYEWAASQASKSYGVNGLNQLTSVGATALGYDLRGNLQNEGATTYGYDALNNLQSSSAGALIGYEPTGRLWHLSVGSGPASNFLYSGSDLVAEYLGAALARRYVPGPGTDAPVVWYEGAGVTDRRYLLSDPQGSIVAVTDGAGVVTATNVYDEYGVPASTNQGRFQYTGQAWLPEVGLYHYKARAYSPTLGRFLQTDPIGYGDGLNWYAYVDNDPLNRSDPAGTEATCVGHNNCWGDPNDPQTGDREGRAGMIMLPMAAAGAAASGIGLWSTVAVWGPAAVDAAGARAAAFGAQVSARGVQFSSTFQRQVAAIQKIENIAANGAKAKDFAGVSKELKGIKTGFDHVAEMRGNVTGLGKAIGKIDEALAGTRLNPAQREALQAWKGAAENIRNKMVEALAQ